MNYARDADEFTPITCIDGLEQPIAFLGVGVVEKPGCAAMVARDQSATVQVFGDGRSLTRMDIELRGYLCGGEMLRRMAPEQQQRLQVRHAVDLGDDEGVDFIGMSAVDLCGIAMIDVERFVLHRVNSRILPWYIGLR